MTINEIFSTIRDWAVGKFQPKGEYASSGDIPIKISELENDEGYISSVPDNYVTDAELDAKGYLTEETDPTVPEWAKQPTKPTYSKAEVGLGNANNTSDVNKPVSTAQQAAIDTAYQQATAYADRIVNALVNGAPSTLDTLGEIAEAMKNNQDVVEALEQAIGTKASEADFTGHVSNTTIHTTASEKTTWNNKMEKTGDASNTTAKFTQATTRANIASGEKLSVIMGKVMKFFADLKAVAFSGSYTDLTDKPSIPTVGNGTLTIQKNGTSVQTFTANQSGNATANIVVPTKTSELTNDSGFKTTDTTYEVVSKSADGLAPKLPNETTTTKYLRQDGTWQVPPNTNNAVTQTASNTNNADYRVLFSATADDTTRTEGARKDTDFKYNPSTNTLTAGKVNADTADSTVTFTSGDATNPTGWADVDVVKSDEKLSSLMRKMSLFGKNVRYLWKLMGSTSLSGIGDGTITGAIHSLNTDILSKYANYRAIGIHGTVIYFSAAQFTFNTSGKGTSTVTAGWIKDADSFVINIFPLYAARSGVSNSADYIMCDGISTSVSGEKLTMTVNGRWMSDRAIYNVAGSKYFSVLILKVPK